MATIYSGSLNQLSKEPTEEELMLYPAISELELNNLTCPAEFKGTVHSIARARQIVFLKLFAKTGRYKPALLGANISRAQISHWRKVDPWFAKLFKLAEEEALDSLEDEAFRRAVDGVDEPVVFQGNLSTIEDPTTGQSVPLTVKKYSDGLLKILLQANIRKYQAKQEVEVKAPTGLLIVPNTSTMTEWEKMAQSYALQQQNGEDNED